MRPECVLILSGLSLLMLSSCISIPPKINYYLGCPPAAVPQRPPPPPEIAVRESEDGDDAAMSKADWRALSVHRAQSAQTLELAFAFIDSCKPGAIK